MGGMAVPVGVVLDHWISEMRIRAKLTTEELNARAARQKAAREAEISRAIGRPYKIRSDF